MVGEVFDDRPVRVARRPATRVSIRSIRSMLSLSCHITSIESGMFFNVWRDPVAWHAIVSWT